MLPERQTQNMVKAIAGSLTPETLAAVIADLDENSQCSDYMQDLADFARRNFRRQLVSLVGEREADRMNCDTAADIETCECGAEGVHILNDNGKCDVCNEMEGAK